MSLFFVCLRSVTSVELWGPCLLCIPLHKTLGWWAKFERIWTLSTAWNRGTWPPSASSVVQVRSPISNFSCQVSLGACMSPKSVALAHQPSLCGWVFMAGCSVGYIQHKHRGMWCKKKFFSSLLQDVIVIVVGGSTPFLWSVCSLSMQGDEMREESMAWSRSCPPSRCRWASTHELLYLIITGVLVHVPEIGLRLNLSYLISSWREASI